MKPPAMHVSTPSNWRCSSLARENIWICYLQGARCTFSSPHQASRFHWYYIGMPLADRSFHLGVLPLNDEFLEQLSEIRKVKKKSNFYSKQTNKKKRTLKSQSLSRPKCIRKIIHSQIVWVSGFERVVLLFCHVCRPAMRSQSQFRLS